MVCLEAKMGPYNGTHLGNHPVATSNLPAPTPLIPHFFGSRSRRDLRSGEVGGVEQGAVCRDSKW
eukprot:3123220-Rhodomonas_salina.2